MIKNLKSKLARHFINLRGWKTKKKIVVIESDDWGSIRTSGEKALHDFKKIGLPIQEDPYTLYDALETNDDLEFLFNILSDFCDTKGNNPKFTINNIVANPDFQQIKDLDFQEYRYEYFTNTLQRYPNSERVFDLYKKSNEEGLISIQFHGREHLHVNNWLEKLKNNDKNTHLAFNHNMFTHFPRKKANCYEQNLDAFGCYSDKDFDDLSLIIKDGLNVFKNIWGFKPESVVSPCHIWDPKVEDIFENNSLTHIQAGDKQTLSIKKSAKKKQKRHFTGEQSKNKMIYTVRNVEFEPSLNISSPIEKALNEIETAFFWRKPAIISSHRLNYIGRLKETNRDKNLHLLKKLLSSILCKWPDIEFLSSDELAIMVKNN